MSISTEKAKLEVTFPKEKMDALRFYMQEKDLTVEEELQKHVKNIYEKYVPAPTRRYLERNDDEQAVPSQGKENTKKNSTRKSEKPSETRNKKKAEKEKVVDKQIKEEAEEAPSQEASQEQAEENQGMVMSM